MKQLKFMICRVRQKVQQTKQFFFSTWLNDDFMFSYKFFKMTNLFRSLKRFKSLKLVTKFLSTFTIHLKFEIFNKNSQFIEKFINESLNFFFNRTSSHRTFIHVSLNLRKLLLKHSRTRQTSLLKLTKFKRWIASRFIEFVNN